MLKVMIVENDLMIADMTEEVLVEGGYEVCGIARSVAEAVALARHHKPDLAIIDLRLDGELGTEILRQLGVMAAIGVLYASGNITHVALTTAHGHAALAKPYSPADLLRGLEIVAGFLATGAASPPFPRGFQMLPPAAPAPAVLS